MNMGALDHSVIEINCRAGDHLELRRARRFSLFAASSLYDMVARSHGVKQSV
jgi:hypothetical protein